jgi:hypothetical protein
LVRAGAWTLLAVSSYWSVRLGWADHLSRSAELPARVRAVSLAPGVASFYDRVADRLADMDQDPLPDLRRAAALEPEDPVHLERLGQQAELARNLALAERSLLAAAARSRLFQPRFLLAQFYFRRGDGARFWPWSRAALESAYGDVLPLLELCWRMRPDAPWLAHEIVPQRPYIQRQLMTFLMRRDEMPAAGNVARRLATSAGIAELPTLMEYVDAVLAVGEAQPASDVWNDLCRRGLLPDPPLRAGTLNNASFRHPPTGRGFDWRLMELAGVRSALGRGELRLTFSGSQPERCTIAWQYVLVEPGEHYQVHCRGATDGVAWRVDDAGPHGDLARVSLVYQRPLGSPRFEGVVVLSDLHLERAPSSRGVGRWPRCSSSESWCSGCRSGGPGVRCKSRSSSSPAGRSRRRGGHRSARRV